MATLAGDLMRAPAVPLPRPHRCDRSLRREICTEISAGLGRITHQGRGLKHRLQAGSNRHLHPLIVEQIFRRAYIALNTASNGEPNGRHEISGATPADHAGGGDQEHGPRAHRALVAARKRLSLSTPREVSARTTGHSLPSPAQGHLRERVLLARTRLRKGAVADLSTGLLGPENRGERRTGSQEALRARGARLADAGRLAVRTERHRARGIAVVRIPRADENRSTSMMR
ncbi:hypothetical protein CESP606_14580 [Cereibacter sphaeroides]